MKLKFRARDRTERSEGPAQFKEHGIEYGYEGERWALIVMATSPEDAMARVRAAAAWGECFTPFGIAAKVPAIAAPFVLAFVWIANLFRKTPTNSGGYG